MDGDVFAVTFSIDVLASEHADRWGLWSGLLSVFGDGIAGAPAISAPLLTKTMRLAATTLPSKRERTLPSRGRLEIISKR